MCGDITISGGTVTASTSKSGAGIGTDRNPSKCGDILISGGTVTAEANTFGAAIGTGAVETSGGSCICGSITITEGITSLTAKVGSILNDGTVIGKSGTPGASTAVCGTVTIDGVANATHSSSFPNLNSNFTSSDSNGSLNVVWTLTKK